MRPNHHRNPNARGRGRGNFNNNRPRFDRNPRNAREPRQICNLKESQVGITEFVGSTTPFNGVIKAKFSDFQVNEIDLDGNIVSLTDLSIPERPLDTTVVEIIETADPELDGLVSAEEWQGIKAISDGDATKIVKIDVTEMSKEDRTKVHVIIKSRFGQSVTSSTVEENERKFIKCSLFNKKGGKFDNRTKWTWPHEYTYFVLHKFNLDTMKACSELALNLGVKPSVLAYAGTKDKRANTSQLFCIKKRDPSVIAKAAQRVQNLYVGNFSFKPETLKLGQLNGNRFKIALRQISVDTSVVEESLKSVQEKGFVNYYGLQRFGNSAAIPTFAIGKALLLGKWSEAVDLILKPRDGDMEYMRKMREYWWETKDAKGAREMLHKTNNSIEGKLLFGLAKHSEKDFVNALENIPRNVRLLYLHSYQSLLWNKAASKRVKLGLKPIEGDLVYVDKRNTTEVVLIDELIDEEVEETLLEEDSATEKKPIDFKGMVKPLSKSDIDAGTYTIFDVVLPLPGHDITYPNNEIGEYYNELLAEDGLTSETLKQKNKTYSLTGAYRKLLEKPENMSWKFAKYNTEDNLLLNTDFQLIKKDRLIQLPENGTLTACLLEFSLNSSTYATMALREILKIDTSTEHQMKLAKGETTDEKEKEVEKVEDSEPLEKKVKLDSPVE